MCRSPNAEGSSFSTRSFSFMLSCAISRYSGERLRQMVVLSSGKKKRGEEKGESTSIFSRAILDLTSASSASSSDINIASSRDPSLRLLPVSSPGWFSSSAKRISASNSSDFLLQRFDLSGLWFFTYVGRYGWEEKPAKALFQSCFFRYTYLSNYP